MRYMVSHGNHESAQNFNHYTQRFRIFGTVKAGDFFGPAVDMTSHAQQASKILIHLWKLRELCQGIKA